MTIDLTSEEWEFLERMVKRSVALTEIMDKDIRFMNDSDYLKAKKLLDKFIIGRINGQ